MELIETITELDLFGKPSEIIANRTREAARAVLFDENNNVAILDVTTRNFHKIPGGGIEEGEDALVAIVRECMEEAGCEIEITGELGIIKEIREKVFTQTNYGYLGRAIKKVSEPGFIGYEVTEKYKLLWIPIDEAIELFENDKPHDYASHFMHRRDMSFLKKAKELIDITPLMPPRHSRESGNPDRE